LNHILNESSFSHLSNDTKEYFLERSRIIDVRLRVYLSNILKSYQRIITFELQENLIADKSNKYFFKIIK